MSWSTTEQLLASMVYIFSSRTEWINCISNFQATSISNMLPFFSVINLSISSKNSFFKTLFPPFRDFGHLHLISMGSVSVSVHLSSSIQKIKSWLFLLIFYVTHLSDSHNLLIQGLSFFLHRWESWGSDQGRILHNITSMINDKNRILVTSLSIIPLIQITFVLLYSCFVSEYFNCLTTNLW